MWSDVDRDGQRVTLRRELSKNREPRVLPLTGALLELIERRWRAREYRSAARSMDRAGVSQPVAMSITGHKTLSVYQCYRIVNEDDRREVLERTLASIKMAPPSKITPIRD